MPAFEAGAENAGFLGRNGGTKIMMYPFMTIDNDTEVVHSETQAGLLSHGLKK